MKSSQKTTRAGDICLYGNHTIGFGWLAQAANGRMFGSGEPCFGRSATGALWLAGDALRSNGHVGTVRIFAPGGEQMATARLQTAPGENGLPYYGDLKWEAAPVYTISAEEIIRAASAAA